MVLIYALAFVLFMIGILAALRITPTQIRQDAAAFSRRDRTLSYQVEQATGKRKRGKIAKSLHDLVNAVESTHSENSFTRLCIIMFFVLMGGIILLAGINQIVLIAVLVVIVCMVPFLYAKSLLMSYHKVITDELEGALTTITASYIANNDIITAVRECLSQAQINPPVSDVFRRFLSQTLVNSNIKLAIIRMSDEIDNNIFREWCETLAACQDNGSLKCTLQPTVDKYCDERIVNAELEAELASERKSFYLMVALLVANIPLLLLINQEWFDVLVNTTQGQFTLAFIAIDCLFCTIRMRKLTQPITYKR